MGKIELYSIPNIRENYNSCIKKGYVALPMNEPQRPTHPPFLTIDEHNKTFSPSYTSLGSKKEDDCFHIAWYVESKEHADSRLKELREVKLNCLDVFDAMQQFKIKYPDVDAKSIKYVINSKLNSN